MLIHVIIIIAVEYCLNWFDFIDDFSPRVSSVEISYSDIGFSALGMPGRTLVDFSLLLSQIGKSIDRVYQLLYRVNQIYR